MEFKESFKKFSLILNLEKNHKKKIPGLFSAGVPPLKISFTTNLSNPP
jgi:hypothetical protein